jgi:hypothetical protein
VAFAGAATSVVLFGQKAMIKQTSLPGQLLSRKALAARWQTSTETIKRRERAGKLKPLHFNQRLVRYKLADVEAIEAEAGGVR